MSDYDAIVIGSGAGGGVVACVLAEAGHRVLLLERGESLDFARLGRDHLRNQRFSLLGHNAGPDLEGNPRVFVDPLGRQRVVRPHEPDYHNNAMCVGGGTRVYGAQAWRFMPDDFRMASVYGVPDGSSLADWPIGYDDLEPYYDRAEWELGVSGDATAARAVTPRTREYPMPPIPRNAQSVALERGAAELGWRTSPVPLLINSEEYSGRGACIGCPYCIGFACPTSAKSGSHNTTVARAVATGLCELVTRASVERLETASTGEITGVSYFVYSADGVAYASASARVVVVSAGAVESARLLLNSTSSLHPNGIGNAYDQVGRNIQGHLYPIGCGITDEHVLPEYGPGVSIATTQFNHGNAGVVGGGMLADDFIKPPIDFWYTTLPPDLPRWGVANKRFMRENFTRVLHIRGPVQDIPSPDGRVTVDPSVRDRLGIPVARLSGTTHPATVDAAAFMRERAEEWLRASGCHTVWSSQPGLVLSGKQHQAGTCRMGDDPRTSVTDRWGRVHGHDRLFVVDGSLHVTNGGFNPVLTILALAFRSAEHIATGL